MAVDYAGFVLLCPPPKARRGFGRRHGLHSRSTACRAASGSFRRGPRAVRRPCETARRRRVCPRRANIGKGTDRCLDLWDRPDIKMRANRRHGRLVVPSRRPPTLDPGSAVRRGLGPFWAIGDPAWRPRGRGAQRRLVAGLCVFGISPRLITPAKSKQHRLAARRPVRMDRVCRPPAAGILRRPRTCPRLGARVPSALRPHLGVCHRVGQGIEADQPAEARHRRDLPPR